MLPPQRPLINKVGPSANLTAIRWVYTIPRPMQTSPLPDQLDPWRLTVEGGQLDGVIALVVLPRLAAVLEHTDGEVNIALVAGIDANGVRFITGCVRTEIALVCQRCLEPLQWLLDVTVRLGLVHDEAEADRLSDEYEPLLVPEGLISIADLIEDELLLALPPIPRHNTMQECEANGYPMPSRKPTPNPGRGQPFATLASLLRETNKRS